MSSSSRMIRLRPAVGEAAWTCSPDAARLPRAEPVGFPRQSQWIWAFLCLGIAVRAVRYFLRFPLFGDEALLAANFLDRGYLDLLRPLGNHQVAPLLFLWVELAVTKGLGFSEFSLRLVPFLCSIGSLFLFRDLAGRLFQGTALMLAVAIFSVSYPCVRYAAEVKPYGCDLFVTLVLMSLTVRWRQRPQESRWLWALAAVVPLALGMSYPAVFIAGGVSLTVGAVLLSAWLADRKPPWRSWLAWAVFNVVLIASFGGLFVLSTGRQADAEKEVMTQYWEAGFPPLDSLGGLVKWLAATHTGSLVQHPIGDDHWGSVLTFLACAVAAVIWWRGGRYQLLLLCGTPFVLNFIAALLHRYPYGGHMRLTLYLGPIVCLMAGYGAAAVLGRQSGRQPRAAEEHDAAGAVPSRRRVAGPVAVRTFMAILAVLAAGSIVRDFCHPYRTLTDQRYRAFAVWFWESLSRDRELVCVKTDLGRSFTPPSLPEGASVSPVYLCNQRIYSPRHAAGRPPRMDLVSRSRPLCCVQYRSQNWHYDQAAFGRWLEGMKSRYELVSRMNLPQWFSNVDDGSGPVDYVELYEFVPKRR